MGVEDSASEHGDTDEEAVDDSEHEVQSNTEEDEEMDDDNVANNNVADNNVANNNVANSDDDDNSGDEDSEEETYNLTYLIKDITSIHDYCIALRKEYRKALKQLNNLDEYDRKKPIESYAKLEVRVKNCKELCHT